MLEMSYRFGVLLLVEQSPAVKIFQLSSQNVRHHALRSVGNIRHNARANRSCTQISKLIRLHGQRQDRDLQCFIRSLSCFSHKLQHRVHSNAVSKQTTRHVDLPERAHAVVAGRKLLRGCNSSRFVDLLTFR